MPEVLDEGASGVPEVTERSFWTEPETHVPADARLAACTCPACCELVRVEDMAVHDCGWCPWRDDPEAWVQQALRLIGT